MNAQRPVVGRAQPSFSREIIVDGPRGNPVNVLKKCGRDYV